MAKCTYDLSCSSTCSWNFRGRVCYCWANTACQEVLIILASKKAVGKFLCLTKILFKDSWEVFITESWEIHEERETLKDTIFVLAHKFSLSLFIEAKSRSSYFTGQWTKILDLFGLKMYVLPIWPQANITDLTFNLYK